MTSAARAVQLRSELLGRHAALDDDRALGHGRVGGRVVRVVLRLHARRSHDDDGTALLARRAALTVRTRATAAGARAAGAATGTAAGPTRTGTWAAEPATGTRGTETAGTGAAGARRDGGPLGTACRGPPGPPGERVKPPPGRGRWRRRERLPAQWAADRREAAGSVGRTTTSGEHHLAAAGWIGQWRRWVVRAEAAAGRAAEQRRPARARRVCRAAGRPSAGNGAAGDRSRARGVGASRGARLTGRRSGADDAARFVVVVQPARLGAGAVRLDGRRGRRRHGSGAGAGVGPRLGLDDGRLPARGAATQRARGFGSATGAGCGAAFLAGSLLGRCGCGRGCGAFCAARQLSGSGGLGGGLLRCGLLRRLGLLGLLGRVRPSRTARRRSRSACASISVEEWALRRQRPCVRTAPSSRRSSSRALWRARARACSSAKPGQPFVSVGVPGRCSGGRQFFSCW